MDSVVLFYSGLVFFFFFSRVTLNTAASHGVQLMSCSEVSVGDEPVLKVDTTCERLMRQTGVIPTALSCVCVFVKNKGLFLSSSIFNMFQYFQFILLQQT